MTRHSFQRGALFGMDARITLMIFAAIATVAGAYIALNLNTIRGHALTDELKQLSDAVEGIHNDIKTDLHTSLTVNDDQNAFISLYDSSVLNATAQGKWLGPYIKQHSDVHPRYGNSRLTKMQEDHLTACTSGVTCYIWLTFSDVPYKVATTTNEDFDGEAEGTPAASGRVQWTGAGPVTLFFRATHTLQ